MRALHRFAVKGLERDELPSVLLSANEGFPSDRRWALHFDDAKPVEAGEWLHKSNFLCVFTATELLAGFDTSFDDAFAPPPAQPAASEWNPAPLAKGGSFNPDDPFA